MRPSSPSISRRQWLVTSGLGVSAGLALPSLLEASTPSVTAATGATDWDAFEREVTSARRAAGPIRLNYNENPFGMSPKAKAAIMSAWDDHNKYGLESYGELRLAFARHVDVPPECVLVTQGSSEVLDVAALAYGLNGGEIVTPWPTFEGIVAYGEAIGAKVHRVPLDAALGHDFDAMERRITGSTRLVFVCNPNNPTGNLADGAKLRDFVRTVSSRAVVLVDEAYHDFVDDPGYRSLVDLVRSGGNVIISRTASKIHGLAGLRVGFAIARPDIIARMASKTTGSPNAFGMRAAIAALADTEYQAFVKQRTHEGRALLTRTLGTLGRRVVPSQTNFVFFHAGMPVNTIGRTLEAKGFLVGRAFPPYGDWCRVSIGTPEEMTAFVAELPAALRA